MQVDEQVDLLVQPISRIAKEIADLLAKIPFADSFAKAQMLKKIELLLQEAEEEVRKWAEEELAKIAEEHDDRTLLILVGFESARSIDGLVSQITKQLRVAVRQASRNSLVLGHRLASTSTSRTTVSEILRTRNLPPFKRDDKAAQELFERQVRDEVRRGFVTVLGRNGQTYRYALDYWVALQAFMARQLLLRQISVFRTQEAGFDLVQISNNRSTIGDFCDLYRGRVFSISGTHQQYPALSSVPNGGPPMHIWCRHTLLPYTSDVFDPKLADVPEAFLNLAEDGRATANDFQRLWLEHGDELVDAD